MGWREVTEYLISLIGKPVAKKNVKRTFRGKDGKAHATYGAAQLELDRLATQIPPEMRDLGLLHPDIEVWFTVSSGRSDKDNGLTTILDLLVSYRVLRNDSVASCNGVFIIHPAVLGSVDKTLIKLTDTGIDRWPAQPRKKRVKP